MKKFILLLFLGVFALSVNAQVVTSDPDTITNAGTADAIVKPGGGSVVVGVQVVVTKISGTVAGNCKLFGSIDGLNYVQIETTDSLALTDVATQTYIWQVAPSPYDKLKCTCTGSGTMSAGILAKAIRRD